MKVGNFDTVNQILARYIPDSVESAYTLSRMTKIMGLLGNPQDTYKAVHIAGTAGKTSTSYYIAKMLQLSGKKVGLTISPHMDEVNERLQINNTSITEAKYCDYFAEFMEIEGLLGLKPTYFELLVAFAYWVFSKEHVDYAVVEVGLGGLVDGTNVINREDKVCVITDIGLDHTRILGNTLPEIAHQKAGIIHSHNQVFMASQEKLVEKVISGYAQSVKAGVHIVNAVDEIPEYLPLYQQRNWSLAKNVFDYVASRDNLSKLNEEDIDKSAQIVVPGRMEVRRLNNKTVILDGAHNGAKFEALSKSLVNILGPKKAVFLLGMVQSKEMHLNQVVKSLSPFASEIICTSVQPLQEMPRTSLNPGIIEDAFKSSGIQDVKTVRNLETALGQAMQSEADTLVITGSLYLLSEVRKLLKKEKKTMIRFIAALDSKKGLADDRGIPWQGKIPGDVAQFRDKTVGGAVMMGAGWYKEQIKPLPYRRNLVATSSPEELRPGFEKVTDAYDFLKNTKDDIWAGGGAGLFASTLDLADELYLTRIDHDFNCTKFFPDFEDKFTLKSESKPITENNVTYRYQVWMRS